MRGDYVKIQMDNDEHWLGEVVAEEKDTLDVYYIQKGEQNVWTYSEDAFEVPQESVIERVRTSECANVLEALKRVGLRPLSDSTFARIDEQGDVPVGDEALELDAEEDFVGIHPEMRDFIVPDEEGEAFTFAQGDSAFVRETHEAVRMYNQWQPEGEAQRIKTFIDRMDDRACAQENARTRLGEGLSYNNPPTKTVDY
tara:strand:+ start:2352 stop:2945 length:594 start_codon:yes stop_codon:yes gene_type:complete